MSILFAGTPNNAALTLRSLLLANSPISLVLTREDAPTGRKGTVQQSPVAEVAAEFGIPVIKANSITPSTISTINASSVRAAVVVAYGVLLNEEALKALANGWFNLHYSLLPRWRGAAPVQHALINGDTVTGVSLFKIDSGLDTGPIVATVQTTIEPNEDAGRLLERLTQLGISLLLEQIPAIDVGAFKLEPQPGIGITKAPKLSRADAEIDFHRTASDIRNLIRGANPEPGAWCTFDSGVLKLLEAESVSGLDFEVGSLNEVSGSIFIGTAKGAIKLLTVQPAGKKPMPATDWYRGLRDKTIRLGHGL